MNWRLFWQNMSSWREIIKRIYPDMQEFYVKVIGNSMFPTIKSGECVHVLTGSDLQLYIGDIVVFRYRNEGFLIHRLMLKHEQTYYCKGDNSIGMEMVDEESIIGVVKIQNDFLRTQEFMTASLKIAELSNLHKRNHSSSFRNSMEFKQYWNKYLNRQ